MVIDFEKMRKARGLNCSHPRAKFARASGEEQRRIRGGFNNGVAGDLKPIGLVVNDLLERLK